MTTNDKPIVFKASFADTQSAIKSGNDGMRITLDIPESDLMNALQLYALRGKVMQVTITQADSAPVVRKSKIDR